MYSRLTLGSMVDTMTGLGLTCSCSLHLTLIHKRGIYREKGIKAPGCTPGSHRGSMVDTMTALPSVVGLQRSRSLSQEIMR